jgi:hypothetical protein
MPENPLIQKALRYERALSDYKSIRQNLLDLFKPYPGERYLEAKYTLTHKPDSMPGRPIEMIARISRFDPDAPQARLTTTISYPLDEGEEVTLSEVDFDAGNFDEIVELMEKPEIKNVQRMLGSIKTQGLLEFKPPVE